MDDCRWFVVLGWEGNTPQGLKPPSFLFVGEAKPEGLAYLEAKARGTATARAKAKNAGVSPLRNRR
jgi:hypothetical protein